MFKFLKKVLNMKGDMTKTEVRQAEVTSKVAPVKDPNTAKHMERIYNKFNGIKEES